MAAFETIRVLIADDHQIVRDGLRSLLEKEADIQVVGIAKEGRTALKMVQDLAPQVVVMDVSMPDLNGIEATHLIRKDFPEVKVIALSMHTAPQFVINMMQAGAAGYLIKDCAWRELSEAIRMVANKNQVYLSPGIAEILEAKSADSSIFTELSSSEREVLQLIAEGTVLERLREWQDQAYLDELTRIANRRHLEIFIAARFNELERFARPFGVIFADLDHFKQVNDTFGHQVGDSILKMVAETMVKTCRSYDLAGRWGGEEFLWVLGNLQDEGQLKTAAERLRNLVANSSLTLPDHDVRVTISLGATMARPQDTLETLIRRVDSLLYLSKAAGRNVTTFG
ncbi:MAG: diguanylate cyclase [Desulfobaccales bacterium]|jgi:diguanylate cyclase (GGDEF)-like protein